MTNADILQGAEPARIEPDLYERLAGPWRARLLEGTTGRRHEG